jgi:hypothetical protein
MRRFVLVALLMFGSSYALFCVAVWYLTEGFSPDHIQSDGGFSPKWEILGQDEGQARELLCQPFYYIAKGSQCYVFLSADQKHVLKFFRHARYRLPPLARYITAPAFLATVQEQKKNIKQKKLEALFASCKLAFMELKEESGLIYLHLNPTTHLQQTVVLYDKLKRAYSIPIDAYTFMIQKKGEHLFPYLTRLLAQGRRHEAKIALSRLANLLSHRIQKGISDNDAVIHKNAGFCGQEALFLDIGGFCLCGPQEHTLWQTTQRFRTWLQKQDPELALLFEQKLLL